MPDFNELDTKLLDPRWYKTDDYLTGFRRLRDEDPVHWTVDPVYGKDYWAITRFEDCEALLLNHDIFSNRWDTHVPTTPQRITPEQRYAQGFDVGMPFTDNPVHDVYRRPFNKHFSVPAIAKLSGLATEAIDQILDEAADQGTDDVVTGLALAVPTRVVLRWFGIPDEDWADVQVGVRETGRGFTPISADYAVSRSDEEGGDAAWEYSERVAADRMANPRDDFLSVIAHLQIDGDKMSLHEVTANIYNLLEGALGNTRNAIAMGLWLLLAHRDQAELLREQPNLIGSAVDEMLRYASNSPTRLRIANQNTEIGGKEITAGDWVVGFLKSANFDERQFDEPERFDITRRPKHLSFGAGIHNCLGRQLARLEMSVLFSKLLESYDFSFADEPEWGTNAPGSKMLSKMNVTFTRR
jgi:cholest-4-en-3-one 26-monooxygenase